MSTSQILPIVNEPVPSPQRWGDAELQRLSATVRQKSLFYWNGPQNAALQEEFRKHYPLKHLFTTSSGSAALHVAVASLRLKPGDEVIVSPLTDMGSLIGILFQQGVPVFTDVDPQTCNAEPEAALRAITPKTRAIMAVHLAGNPCDMSALNAIAREHGLAIIEDCAQSWGARHQGTPVGLLGDISCYSFNDFKHLSCGDGGIVGTNRDDLGNGLSKWGDKCYDRTTPTRDPEDLAANYRMGEPLAAVAAAQLTRFESIVSRRVRNGARLTEQLSDIPGIRPTVTRPGDTHSYWFYLLRLELSAFRGSRSEFSDALRQQGVAANPGYLPMPVYHYKVFRQHNFFGGTWPARDLGATKMDYTKVRCPAAEAILNDCITLPINEAMTDAYIDKVALAIRHVADRLQHR